MHLDQILKNLENEFGTLYQKTGLNNNSAYISIFGFVAIFDLICN